MIRLLFFPLLLLSLTLSAQSWTKKELASADAAASIDYLTTAERDAIRYINLARMYPAKFAELELANYYGPAKYGGYLRGSSYLASLLTTLQTMEPVPALVFDEKMYEAAKCLAAEQSRTGATGHARTQCPAANVAECASYGMATGKDITMQWLIDHDVPSLGHRKNCLNKAYTKIGLSANSHPKFGQVAIADMIW